LSENLPYLDFREFPHHQLDTHTPTVLNGPTSRNPVDLNQVNVEARQLVHLYLSTRKLSVLVAASNETEKCGTTFMHEAQFLANDQWHVGQQIRHDVFKERCVIPPCKPVWKCVGPNKLSPQILAQLLMENRMWIFICPHVLIVRIQDSISCELSFFRKYDKGREVRICTTLL
jgi:hypothetical protein